MLETITIWILIISSTIVGIALSMLGKYLYDEYQDDKRFTKALKRMVEHEEDHPDQPSQLNKLFP